MNVQEIAAKLEEKYPARRLLAIALNKPLSNERTGVVLMELTDDSAAKFATWIVNYYQENNVYTASGEYFHVANYDLDKAREEALASFKARILA
jgi:hypothetical protein